jgi:hypothetical protein
VQHGPSDDGQQQQSQEDDPAIQARKQVWQSYYQQLAALQQSRQLDAANAMKADTTPNGMTGSVAPSQAGGGPVADPQVAQAQGTAPQAGMAVPAAYPGGAGFALAPGRLGVGSGYPILPPAGLDPAGAREKQAFTGQADNLGQNDTLAATVRDPISPYLITAGDVIPVRGARRRRQRHARPVRRPRVLERV